MNNLSSIRYLGVFALLGFVSCSTNHSALKGESDDLYFMASDAQVATEFAVKNNNPDNFKQLEEINAEEYDQENFSAKNVNPEYIAKYQNNNTTPEDEGTVYFDDAEGDQVQAQDGDINIYNNFRGYNAPSGNTAWNRNPWMMSPYMSAFSPWGMGGFYDPFWGSGFGFRPGLSLSLGMGFGMGSRFGMGFGHPMMRYGYGMGGFYDPFYSPYMGYGYGYGMNYYNRPIIILPGGSENQRQIVRGTRPSRSSNLATGNRTRATNVASPGSTRATARREAVSRNSMTSRANARATSRNDFSRSQNDFYNGNIRGASAASAAPSSRNVNSPAMSRAGSTSTNRNTYTAPESRTTRTQAPSNVNTRRSSSDSRTRYAAPSRSSSPSYNRSTSPRYNNNRSSTPNRNISTPARTRSSSPSYSAPSRSSGGGATRSSGGSSRRGN